MNDINKRYIGAMDTILRTDFVCHRLSEPIRYGTHLRITINICPPIIMSIIMFILMLLLNINIAIASDPNSALIKVRIYSVAPNKLVGVSQLKKEPFTDLHIIDLSVIPEMEAIFNAYINDEKQQLSVAEMKTAVEQLADDRLQKLAAAQLHLFDLQTRYDVMIDDLPIAVIEHQKNFYLYKGNDVYAGFLLWQQSKQ